MYAIVRDGGHQFKAVAGQKILVELRDVKPGEEIVFDQVLMVGGDPVKVGAPTISGARVLAVADGEVAGEKVRGLRKRERDSSQTRFGHRQKYTSLTIKEIVAG
jgi:large subunit ribosomal protein L21